jgi:predicted hydrocarbon binding protein
MEMKKSVMILGAAIKPVFEAFLNKEYATKLIEQAFGTKSIDPDMTYPAAIYIDTLRSIETDMSAQVVRKVGRFMIENAKWPSEIENLEQGLASIDTAYRMNHIPNTKADIGEYGFKKVDESTFEIHCDNPYPCALDLGIVTGVTTRFDKKAYVSHGEGCRENGDTKCVYVIKK